MGQREPGWSVTVAAETRDVDPMYGPAGTTVVVSWNMAGSASAWSYVSRLNPSIVLAQEAPPPAVGQVEDLSTWPERADPESWSTWGRPGWKRCAAVGYRTGLAEPLPTTRLAEAASGEVTVSQPGAFAAMQTRLHDGTPIVAVSLYGLWQKVGSLIESESSLHRSISDLTPLLIAARGRGVLVAGDLNLYLDHDDFWAAKYATVVDRLAAYGLTLVGPSRGEAAGPMPGCRCGPMPTCRHVQTIHYRGHDDRPATQTDFVFATPDLAERAVECTTISTDASLSISDHTPIVTTLR